MDLVSCVSCVSWEAFLYSAETYETLHRESGMRYQHHYFIWWYPLVPNTRCWVSPWGSVVPHMPEEPLWKPLTRACVGVRPVPRRACGTHHGGGIG
jgi:hypothetical protein